MDLLTNATSSICAGVEDYQDGSDARLLTAVRNIHAGILLLFKEVLLRLSPTGSEDALIKSKILPIRDGNGNVTFVGVGKKTVDVQQIKERFGRLGITTDWVRFDRMSDVRNEIEHHYTTADKKALEGVVSDAFVIIRDFVTVELKEDPRHLLGEETWDAMLKISEVYEAERNDCRAALEKIDWKSDALAAGVFNVTCPSCSGALLRPDGEYKAYTEDMGLECRSCGDILISSKFVLLAIDEALGHDKYLSYTDGGEDPYTTCPVCFEETYIMEEKQCAHCGESVEHECTRCGNEIPPSELMSSPLCGYCQHMTSKDD